MLMQSLDEIIRKYRKQPITDIHQLDELLSSCDKYFDDNHLHSSSITGKTSSQSYYPLMTRKPFYPMMYWSPIREPALLRTHDFIPNPPSSLNSQEIEKIPKNIDVHIDSMQDLLLLIENNPYEAKYEYNINLQSLHLVYKELKQIKEMIGLKEFKNELLNQLLYFSQNLHQGGEGDFMHTVLCGPPGTGKTEIAMLLGTMYSKLGLLSKNKFKKVCRNDLVAGYLGQTALKTRKVIDESLGGVLFIDEAYSLANDYNGDSFSRECIDVLCEALSSHKKDLMVIIAGYENQLDSTFFQANQGLKSRFIWKFNLNDYNAEELVCIFTKKIHESEWTICIDDKTLVNWMSKYKKTFIHYGRDMEQLFSYVKIAHGRRIYGDTHSTKKEINQEALENGYKKFTQNSLHKEYSPPMGMYM